MLSALSILSTAREFEANTLGKTINLASRSHVKKLASIFPYSALIFISNQRVITRGGLIDLESLEFSLGGLLLY